MPIYPDNGVPIYQQIASWIEEGILTGLFEKDEKVYSQYQLAEQFCINPATAAKGLSLLADEGILYKKRGLGMFVSADAKKKILKRRSSGSLKEKIRDLASEAKLLGLTKDDVVDMIRQEMEGAE